MVYGIICAVLIAIVILSLLSRGSSAVDIPDNITEEDVKQLMRKGRKIEAIKYYRHLHGLGLKEAKEAVEKMEL